MTYHPVTVFHIAMENNMAISVDHLQMNNRHPMLFPSKKPPWLVQGFPSQPRYLRKTISLQPINCISITYQFLSLISWLTLKTALISPLSLVLKSNPGPFKKPLRSHEDPMKSYHNHH
jgi:hypothetical protein